MTRTRTRDGVWGLSETVTARAERLVYLFEGGLVLRYEIKMQNALKIAVCGLGLLSLHDYRSSRQ